MKEINERKIKLDHKRKKNEKRQKSFVKNILQINENLLKNKFKK